MDSDSRKVIVDHDLVADTPSNGGSIDGQAWGDGDFADEQLSRMAKHVLRGRRLEVFEALITARSAWKDKGDVIRALAQKHGVTVER
jgi:hypothetical protein